MSLNIYSEADVDTKLSTFADFTNPLLITLDGRAGGVLQKRIYARNDDENKSYTNISITVKADDTSLIDDSRGISWKLAQGETRPTEEEWALTSAANTISLPDLGDLSTSDINTFSPFWVRVEIPRATDIQTVRQIYFSTVATENIV